MSTGELAADQHKHRDRPRRRVSPGLAQLEQFEPYFRRIREVGLCGIMELRLAWVSNGV